MDRIKSIALTTLGMIIALAALGVFAYIGLAVIGAVFVLCAVVAIAAAITGFVAKSETTIQTSA